MFLRDAIFQIIYLYTGDGILNMHYKFYKYAIAGVSETLVWNPKVMNYNE